MEREGVRVGALQGAAGGWDAVVCTAAGSSLPIVSTVNKVTSVRGIVASHPYRAGEMNFGVSLCLAVAFPIGEAEFVSLMQSQRSLCGGIVRTPVCLLKPLVYVAFLDAAACSAAFVSVGFLLHPPAWEHPFCSMGLAVCSME